MMIDVYKTNDAGVKLVLIEKEEMERVIKKDQDTFDRYGITTVIYGTKLGSESNIKINEIFDGYTGFIWHNVNSITTGNPFKGSIKMTQSKVTAMDLHKAYVKRCEVKDTEELYFIYFK